MTALGLSTAPAPTPHTCTTRTPPHHADRKKPNPSKLQAPHRATYLHPLPLQLRQQWPLGPLSHLHHHREPLAWLHHRRVGLHLEGARAGGDHPVSYRLGPKIGDVCQRAVCRRAGKLELEVGRGNADRAAGAVAHALARRRPVVWGGEKGALVSNQLRWSTVRQQGPVQYCAVTASRLRSRILDRILCWYCSLPKLTVLSSMTRMSPFAQREQGYQNTTAEQQTPHGRGANPSEGLNAARSVLAAQRAPERSQ